MRHGLLAYHRFFRNIESLHPEPPEHHGELARQRAFSDHARARPGVDHLPHQAMGERAIETVPLFEVAVRRLIAAARVADDRVPGASEIGLEGAILRSIHLDAEK